MKKLILIILVIGGLFVCKKAYDQYKDYMYLKDEVRIMDETEISLKTKIENIKLLPSSKPKNIKESFGKLITKKNIFAEYFDVVITVSIPGYLNEEDIDLYIQTSDLPGVKNLPIKISVFGYVDKTDKALVLESFRDLETELDLKIESLSWIDETLEITTKLYGV